MTTDFVAHYDRWILEAAIAGFYANGYAADPDDLKKAVPNIKRQHRNRPPFWAIVYSYFNGRAVTLARAQEQEALPDFAQWFRQAVEDWALEQPPRADPASCRQLSPPELVNLRPILAEAMAEGYAKEGLERSSEACLPMIDELLGFGPSIPVHILVMEAYFGARAEALRAGKQPEGEAAGNAAYRRPSRSSSTNGTRPAPATPRPTINQQR